MTTTTTTATPATIDLPTVMPGSDLAMIHRNAHLREALGSIPQWRQAAEDLTHLQAVRPAAQRYASAEEEISAWLAAAVRNREQLDPETVAERARAVHADVAAKVSVLRASEALAKSYAAQLDEAVRANEAVLYGSLTDQVREVVQRAREVADCFGLSADRAIATGRAKGWAQAQECARAYTALAGVRATLAQRLGWGGGAFHGWEPFEELRWIRNPREVFSHWREWRRDGAIVNPKNVKDRQPLQAPWPTQTRPAPAEWLAFLAATAEAEPWVPTFEQFARACAEHTEYLHAEDSGIKPQSHTGRAYA